MWHKGVKKASLNLSSLSPSFSDFPRVSFILMAAVTFSDESFQAGTGTIATAWLPLSSPWPAEESCSTQIYAQRGGLGVNLIAIELLFGESISPLTVSEVPCLPPQVTSSLVPVQLLCNHSPWPRLQLTKSVQRCASNSHQSSYRANICCLSYVGEA